MNTINSVQQYTIQTVSGQITVSEGNLQFSDSILTVIYRFFVLSPLRIMFFVVPLLIIFGVPANASLADRLMFLLYIVGIGLALGAVVLVISKGINHLSPNRPPVSTDNSVPLKAIQEVQLVKNNLFFDILIFFEREGEQKQIVRRFASKKQCTIQEDEIISIFKLHNIDIRLV
jgi:hypothetical protein